MANQTMLEETASSLSELIEKTKRIARRWVPSTSEPEELWFRGQPRASFGLVPGLYRQSPENLQYDEEDIFERFKSLATPYLKRVPSDDWEWYFLAQHFGLPTRLLDWTEGLLAAAYFAMCDCVLSRSRVAIDKELAKGVLPSIFDNASPTVWILDAGTLNASLHGQDISFVPSIDGELAFYLPDRINYQKTRANRLPKAILPPKTNERITSQQGMFTVHGHDTLGLEELASSARRTKIHLARIILDRANISHLWAELQLSGVNQLTLFPDIEHVARHVKWILQFDGQLKEESMLTRRQNPRKSAKKGGKKKGGKKSAKKR